MKCFSVALKAQDFEKKKKKKQWEWKQDGMSDWYRKQNYPGGGC